jgi:glycosyltransferase involved in cell wall biosynthesis
MKNYFFKKGWKCRKNHVIYNGVDKEIFCKRSKLNNGKINLVTHHWSSNRMKGFDIYEKLDSFVGDNNNFTFIYIGRELGTFRNSTVIPPLFGNSLGEELSKYDVYISGTLFDPGPNHILESISCEIPTYSFFKGGGACEFTGPSHIFKSFDELSKILLSRNFLKNNVKIESWEACVKNYNLVMRNTLN